MAYRFAAIDLAKAKRVLKWQRDPEGMRIRILEAAKQEFAAHGLAGARVDRIAAKAGANKRMLYYHVGKKDDLYLEVLEGAYEKIRAEERGLDLEHLDPPEAIERLIDFTWNYFLRNPEFLALLNTENLARARHLKRSTKVKSMHSPFVEMIRTVVHARRRERRFSRRGRSGAALHFDRRAVLLLSLEQRHAERDLRPRSPEQRGEGRAPRSHGRAGAGGADRKIDGRFRQGQAAEIALAAAAMLGRVLSGTGAAEFPVRYRGKAARQYLSNGLISCLKTTIQGVTIGRTEGPGSVSKALNAAWVRPFLFLIFIVVAWDLAIRLFRIPAYQIPAPGDVVAVLWSDWPELLRQAWPTTYATICGFLLSALFGIPVAMLIAGSKTVESYVYPLLVFSQSVPKIAIAPLFVVWFGFGIIPKVISAFLLGFFPVVVSAVQGFKSVDPDMVDLARAMQGSRFQVFRAVNLPHAMPAIFSGLKVSVTLAVVGAVVGEFVGSNSGIGYVLQRSIGTFDLPTMFAALVILALLGVVLFWIVDRIEHFVIPWHVSQREDIIFAS